MDIYPAIDLREGAVVRLEKGDYDRQTVYNTDPVAAAGAFIEAGTRWIHVVDLDAALTGDLVNTAALRKIHGAASGAGVRIQNGGGIRNRERIDLLLAVGIDRLVIGSAALKDWDWFETILETTDVPNHRLALGLDAREGRVAAEGWTEQLDTPATDIAARVRGSGLGAIVYTDISRDGTLSGMNVEETADVAASTDVPVIASGGINSLEDIAQAAACGCGGAILGTALYEGTVRLDAALRTAGEVGR